MWAKYTLKQIVSGKSADGSLLLAGFLKDYAKLEGIELSNLQPSCPTCLSKYYNTYIIKHSTMKNESKYKLKLKYNGISLAFGSSILLTNLNITDEYAEKLISRYLDLYENKSEDFDIAVLFDEYPTDWERPHYKGEEFEDSQLNMFELRCKYPDIKAGSVKSFLKKIKR